MLRLWKGLNYWCCIVAEWWRAGILAEGASEREGRLWMGGCGWRACGGQVSGGILFCIKKRDCKFIPYLQQEFNRGSNIMTWVLDRSLYIWKTNSGGENGRQRERRQQLDCHIKARHVRPSDSQPSGLSGEKTVGELLGWLVKCQNAVSHCLCNTKKENVSSWP